MEFTNETKLELGKYKITCDDGMMYQLTVDTDMYPSNPRRNEDNLGAMVCYDYGDCKSYNDAIEWSAGLCRKYGKSNEKIDGMTLFERMSFMATYDDILALPLYILDHSGLSMATYRQDDWDSRYVGFIYTEKDFFLSSCPVKDTEHWKDYAKKTLLAEVETYSKYLEGSVYVWSVTDYVKVTREDFKGNVISVTYEPYEGSPDCAYGDLYDYPTIQDIKDQIGEFASIEKL